MRAGASFARNFISGFFMRIKHLAQDDSCMTGMARLQPNGSGHVEYSARMVAGLADDHG
jgi:hypothetical protein